MSDFKAKLFKKNFKNKVGSGQPPKYATVGIKKEKARNLGKEGGEGSELDSWLGEYKRARCRKRECR